MKMKIRATAEKLGRRIEGLLWSQSRRGYLGETLRLVPMVLWKFRNDKGPLRASALAFTTALGLVPLLAMAFAVVKGLGVKTRLQGIVIDHLSAGNEQIADRLAEYVSRINVGTLGVAGLASLTFSALLVLSNVEQSFNDIWGVAKGRTLLRKVTDYSAILIVCPILLILSTSLVTTAQVSRYLGDIEFMGKALPLVYTLAPFAAKAVAFGVMYLIVPNHRVGFWAACTGGLLAAVFWHFAEWGYISFGIGMSRNNAVYGALAQLPVFLVWIYLGWCIVIVGAELACVLELPGRGRFLKGGRELWTPRPSVALGLLLETAKRFKRGEPADEDDLIAKAGIHPVGGRLVIGELVEAGLLVRVEGEEGNLVPARDPQSLRMSEVLARITASRKGPEKPDPAEALYLAALEETHGEATWSQWVEKVEKT